MKKNNLILLLAVLSVVGCSKSKDYPTMLSELEKAGSDDKLLQRELANVAPNQCLKDVFSVEMVKAEIRELEKKQAAGTKVKGKWKHFNLEDLPIPQANFLKKFGDKLGDQNNADAYDYSACSDVPCLFNKIYGKPENVAGYVHYLWYLKMGTYLAASNSIYDSKTQTKPGVYSGQNFPVTAYLYRENEIYAWWRLSNMLKAPHTALVDLKEIHRVPQGRSFDFTDIARAKLAAENAALRAAGKPEKAGPGGETCGLAYNSGMVILQDLCLTLYSDWESGNFYDSVLHELTHQVDYHEGRKIKKTYRSYEQDYLDISGFFLKEYKDANNNTIRQWEHKPGIKLVTSYSGTSPAENYAETIAHFRVNGTTTKGSITPAHWNYTSKNYYFDKTFEKTDLIKDWLVTQNSLMAQLAFRAVGNCTKASTGFASSYYKKMDFVTPLLPSMVSCLGAKATEISKEIQSKIKVTDADGCRVLTDYNSSFWDSGFKTQLTAHLNKYLQELQADKTYFAKVQAFHDEIPNRTMANNAFLSCNDPEFEETCYDEQVIKLALAKVAPLNLPAAHAGDLAELYLTSHPIADTRQYLNGYYKSFVVSHKAQIDLEASDVWARCAALPLSDVLPPTGKHFTLADDYMVSSVYNCLNEEFPNSAKNLVRNLAVGDIKVQHPKEEVILYAEVKPELQKSLMDLFVKKKAKENKAALEYIQNDGGSLRKKMLSDFAWVKDVLNSDNLNKDCQKLALEKIDFPLMYQLRAPVFGVLTADACRDIHLSPEYNTWLEESKSVFADKSIDGLEKRIVELADIKAKACLVQYPVDTNLNRIKFKKDREACLIGEWSQIEAAGIKEFVSDPLVIKFKVDIEAVKSQLEVNRRRLQLRVIKENF